MLRVIGARRVHGHRTLDYPRAAAQVPPGFRGLPVVDDARVGAGCAACVEACPTRAITVEGATKSIDLGKCVFCGDCARACPTGAVSLSPSIQLSSTTRQGLVVGGGQGPSVAALEERSRRLLGRSLRLRQVSAGGCNGCEVEAAALQNVVFDFARFGIQFVASPRHADGLLVTGPVTRNMQLALRKTYDAVAAPKVVIAAGACAISGGPFAGHVEVLGGAASTVPVDLYIAGCPPHPLAMLDGLLRLMGRLEGDPQRMGRTPGGA